VTRLVLRCIAVVAAIWLAGLAWFVYGLDGGSPAPDATTDAIVVLTGGSQRLDSGLSLLVAGKAKKLFVSGVHPGVAQQDMFRGRQDAERWIECCVVLGHAADNTEGNAVETEEWLRAEGYHSLRLVTANYHMRRALLEFRRVLPPEDLIVPDPVAPEAGHGASRVVVVEYMKYLGALLRPLVRPLLGPAPSPAHVAAQGAT
jgi:uncharacterized SAM-binding protein YcdF (DUF218 family)